MTEAADELEQLRQSERALTAELADALARQAAMTDVLDAVATARTDLQPVFDAITRWPTHSHGTE